MLKGLKLKFGVVIAALSALWLALGAYLAFFRGGSASTLTIVSEIGLLALFSLYVLVFCFNRWVITPIHRMNGILKGMSEGGGDLTQRLDMASDDEIGEMAGNLNVFLGCLRDLVAKAQESSFLLHDLSKRVGEKSRTLSNTAQEQAMVTNDNFRSLERMNSSVQDVAGGAESLNITTTDSSATVIQMSSQVEMVAENTMDLSGHVEEASLSINEMTVSIREVAENVRMLSSLAFQTTESVTRIENSIKEVEAKAKLSAALSQEVSEDADSLGNQAIARTIEGMELIRESVEEASSVIEGLSGRSVEIGQIVKVIDEVMNQTSLLALNAAILAAQAGEHGKGFAVVANEIKDLAERTSSSTGEIKRLIKSVQESSMAAVESMRAGRERVLEGAKMAYGAGEALTKMIESSNRSMETAMQIEKATTQQVRAARDVSDATNNVHERIKYIEKAMQDQTKGSELIAGAASKMSDIAKEVRKAMSEQTRGIKDFARSIEETKEMVGTIANATRNQSDDSIGLVGSMEKFLEIAQMNKDISAEMEELVDKLLHQTEALRDEMGRFRV